MPEMLACLEAAGCAAVAGQRLGRVGQRALHGRVVLLLGQLLACQPLRGSHQGGLPVQMLYQACASRCPGFTIVALFFNLSVQRDQGLQQIQRGCLLVLLAEQLVDVLALARGGGNVHQQLSRQRQRGRGLLGQAFQRVQGLGRLPHAVRSEEHTSELQSQSNLVCRLLLEKKKKTTENESEPNIVRRFEPRAERRRSPTATPSNRTQTA